MSFLPWFGGALAGVLALVLAGCELEDPYEADRGPSPSPRGEPVPHVAEARVERFAAAWIQWTSEAAPEARADLEALASRSLAQRLFGRRARAMAGIRAAGRVEGVLRQPAGRVIVVTHETVHFDGGGSQSQYNVYLARVRHVGEGWRVVRWQPVL